ncbi:MAG: hypothetical protein KJ985_00645, partial [Proteobacteria bacterium]|nr:hypothetical protein [Pseudomonadota bacterium]
DAFGLARIHGEGNQNIFPTMISKLFSHLNRRNGNLFDPQVAKPLADLRRLVSLEMRPKSNTFTLSALQHAS